MIEYIEMGDNNPEFPTKIAPINHLEDAAQYYQQGDSFHAGRDYGKFYMAVTTGRLEDDFAGFN